MGRSKNNIKTNKRRIKTYKGDYYSINSILGNDWARWFILTGGREAGKSYSVLEWAIRRKRKLGNKLKFYWFRLTDKQVENLLINNADKLIDPDLKRKYGINNLMRKGNSVYTYDTEERITKTGNVIKEKKNIELFCDVISCSTFHNNKGVGYFDNEYDGEYLLVLDEMNREATEKNSFDIVNAFSNTIENLVRSTRNKMRIICIGNTLEEVSDLVAAFNFIPDDFGRYKIKKKYCVIDNIKPSEKYLERRKDAAANQINGNSSSFTNEIEIDRSLLVNKRLATRPHYIIRFGKTQDKWFTLWNNNIIKVYNKEQVPVIAMTRYLDVAYKDELANLILEKFDNRVYRFTEISTFKKFQKCLQLKKAK